MTAQLIVSAVICIVVVHVILIGVAYSIYLERKVSAYIQDRIGPNRVGFDFGLPALRFLRGMVGLGQPLADGLKFFLKEDYTPAHVDKVLFTLAPALIVIPALMGFIIIPWGGTWNVPEFTIPVLNVHVAGGPVQVAGAVVNVGVLYLLAVASLGVYGVTLGGWASNNKFSFLGGLRSTAQMLAYEIPLGLSLLAVLLVVGSLIPADLVGYQVRNGWLILSQPIAAILFFISILAEANRAPFDNAEAEQELVGGYHTEYSSMRFALFFMGEYAHMITSSAFFALVFLGGYHLPLVPWLSPESTTLLAVLAKCLVYFGKVGLLVCFMMVIRWTLPRMRFDQVMMMAWQAVIPLALIVVIVSSVVVYLNLGPRFNLPWGESIPLLVANAAITVGFLIMYPFLPNYEVNRRVPMYGSRFNPVPGERVSTRPMDATALADRPEAAVAGAR
ncbi:MAG: NADH-quinone oxidoreductase subunit NuoH [Phycisphaerales bacterium]|nr:NADH-quinone oxidoreductase subunit NuoH [Phycisphaerales bacterium]